MSLRPSVHSICALFILWQSNRIWLRNSEFRIWPWKFRVKFMAKVKSDGHIWSLRVQSICLLVVSWQSDHFWSRYSEFHVWLWKFKVKVMAKVKSSGHIWGLKCNRYICFLFHGNRTIFGWDEVNSILTLKIQGQCHSHSQIQWSHLRLTLRWRAPKTATSTTPVAAVTWPRSRFNTSGPDPLGFDWEGLAASRGTAGGHSGRPLI